MIEAEARYEAARQRFNDAARAKLRADDDWKTARADLGETARELAHLLGDARPLTDPIEAVAAVIMARNRAVPR